MIASIANVDKALLMSEWGPDFCPSCSGVRPKHNADCAHDLALAERAYPDQASRDRARTIIQDSEKTKVT